jgi:4-amino-4-deoxy-L-arabinose transferase-like glycosyltransferase
MENTDSLTGNQTGVGNVSLNKENTRRSLRDVVKAVWKTARGDENHVFQIVVAVTCVIANFLIGFLYQSQVFIKGWQPIVWLTSLIVLFAVLVPRRKFTFSPNRIWAVVGVIVLVGFLLRAVALGTFPPGFHVDEAGMAGFTLLHTFPNPNETINPFVTGNNSHPALYNYILRFFMDIFGYSIFGDRLSSAVAGTLAILATYFMVKEFSGQRTAIIAAIVLASYNVHIHWSRVGLNNVWTTLWVPLALAFFVWGWRIKWSGGALLSGLSLGLTAYFYSGGYIIVFLMLYLVMVMWRETKQQEGFVVYTSKMLIMALCTSLPLIVFALMNQKLFFFRANEIYAWKPEAAKIIMGDPVNYPMFLWRQLTGSFSVYGFLAEQSGYYTSQVPLLLGASSILFLIGIGWAFHKKLFLPIIWVLYVTILGGFLVAPPFSSQHLIAVAPAVCWLVAIPIDWMLETDHRAWALALLVAVVVVDIYFYFYVYYMFPGRDLNIPFPEVPNFTSWSGCRFFE